MRNLLLVGVGGFIGAVGRYLLVGVVRSRYQGDFPWATLCVNLLGCLLIGSLMSAAEERGILGVEARLLLFTGVIGSFTTFSTFGLETHELLRAGAGSLALAYVAASVILGLGCVWLGRAGTAALF